MKDRTLDYLNQLKPLTTNSRNQGQQIYKNYRNEGISNYPHMQNYQKTIQQMAAEKENEQNIMNQYQQNKLKLDQSEAEKYKALQGQNEQFKTEYQSLQNQLAQKKGAAQQLQNIKQSGASMASIWPQKKNVRPTVNVQPPVVAPRPTNIQQKPQVVNQSPQYPPGTQFAPSNWRSFPAWSYPSSTVVLEGIPGQRVTYPGTPPPWYT
jgi:hypothetical protein